MRRTAAHARAPGRDHRLDRGSHIWNASPQKPNGIEILYHASDIHGETSDANDTRYNALDYGLSVVQPKTPAILRTLFDMSMAENKADLGARDMEARSQRESCSRPEALFVATDLATRQKAAVLGKVLGEDPDANQAVLAWTRRIRAKFGDRLPAIRQAIASGNPRELREARNLVLRERVGLIMDDSFVDAFDGCAKDNDPAVRSEVARTLGQSLFGFEGRGRPMRSACFSGSRKTRFRCSLPGRVFLAVACAAGMARRGRAAGS